MNTGSLDGLLDGDARTATAVDLTRALVATPSVNPTLEPSGTGEAEIAGLAAGWLEAWGFAVDRFEGSGGRPSIVARLPGRTPGKTLLLNGHLDTVGVDGMSVDPFAAEIRAGRLYGRGACDMKGGLAALLAAARDVAADGADFAGELVVALVADEEHASLGMQEVIDAGVRADGAIVCEPTGLAIMPAHKGFAWYELVFRGRAAHGSRPDRGIDAIRQAGRFLARLDRIEERIAAADAHPLLGHGSIHAGTIQGGAAPSVYPAECRLVLERRTLPAETPATGAAEIDAVLAELRAADPRLDVVVHRGLDRPGTEVATDATLVHALDAAIRGTGGEPVIRGMTAWVDAALFNEAGSPAICYGPGDIEHAHSADESIAVDEIERAHSVLARLIREFCA